MNRYLLLIEDHGFTYDALKSQLKNSGWSVYRGRDEDDTDRTLDIAASNGFSFDFIAIDLGLPPLSDSHDIGLKLAIKLRNFFSSTPILAYTSQTPRSFKYGYVLRELLARKVSFIYSRPEDDSLSFSDIVDIASKGFVLLSDTPAGYLSNAIAIAPDPLMNDNYWNVLKLMS